MRNSVDDFFVGAAAKYLSAVDADPSRSNQHEIGGLPSVGFKNYLGTPGKGEENEYRFQCTMAYLSDSDSPVLCSDTVTWYDCRRNVSHRSPEYRLYYKSNAVSTLMQPSDFFLIAKQNNGELLLLFAPADSSVEYQLRHLFGLPTLQSKSFTAADMPHESLVLPIKLMLDELGIAVFETSDEGDLEKLLSRFPGSFPTTREFSNFARESCANDCIDQPDSALLSWMEREESLFRTYERHLVSQRLQQGFQHPERHEVDEFISFSLSVQNRRKSRVGHAFENHLGEIFKRHKLEFETGGGSRVTENKSKPDFLFPSFHAYHDLTFPTEKLFLLGAKTTCKDRWRQVLSEGDRVERKFLATMEPSISEAQTNEMQSKNLQLVVPSAIHHTFSRDQQTWLYSLHDFICEVKARN